MADQRRLTRVRQMLCGLMVVTLTAAASDRAHAQWPQFRGPNGSGVDAAAGYPVAFSPTTNVVWKTDLPFAQSSPVVAGGHVYLTASEGEQLLTICLDAATGRELWRKAIRRARTHKIYSANDPASPTPAAGDDGVVVFFADFGLAAYTPEGKERWTAPLGPFRNFYGMASSPILSGDLLIMLCDQQSGAFLLALDRKTGRQRWKTDRAGSAIGWATPMVFKAEGGAAQVVVLGSTRLDAYVLETGEQQWWMPLGSSGALGTVVASGDTLYLSTLGSTEPSIPAFETVLSQYDKNKDSRLSHEEFASDKDLGGHFGWIDADSDEIITGEEWNVARMLGLGEFGLIAVRPALSKGKLEAAAVVWRFKKNLPYIPAPLLYQGVLYMVKDGGIVTSLDPATGRPVKEGRAPGALGEYYASPVAADSKVFLSSGDGKVTVLKAGAEWRVLGVNDIGEEIHSTPALSNGRIYVRTRSAIYCFGSAR